MPQIMPRLTITQKSTGRKTTREVDQDSLLIGRLATADIVIDLPTASRRHAEISRIGPDFFIADLGSGNGTLLNGQKLKPHEKNLVKHDALIAVEDYTILFEQDQNEDAPAVNPGGDLTDPGFMEIRMLKKVLGALDADSLPSLEGLTEPIEGKKVVFQENHQELVIGREKNCDFAVETAAISRRHAVLRKKWGGITISDLGSKNHTFVNDTEVKDEKILHDGDIIRFGNIAAVFHHPQEVSLGDLGKELEEKQNAHSSPKPEAQAPSPEAAPVSDQAKFSLGQEDEPSAPEEEKPAPASEPAPPETPHTQEMRGQKSSTTSLQKTRFSFLEMLLLVLGGAVFAAALAALIYLFL